MMAYSPIEDKYLSTLTQQQFPDMPVEQVAAEPSLDGVQLAMGGNAAGRRSDRPVSDVPMALMDMGAATAKGAVQGFAGLPGDLEKLGRVLIGAMGVDLSQDTKLPTTDDVKAWLDTNVGKVGNGQNPYESIGEITAPGGQIKAVKAAAKGAKALAPKAGEMIMESMDILGSPVKMDLMAYHGTPHKFDKFDSKSIGSGEGAQAYGYGFYFSEEKGVAKGYQMRLSSDASAKARVDQFGSVDKAIEETKRKIDHYTQLIENGGGGAMERAQSFLRISEKNLSDLENMKAGKPSNEGTLFSVDIPDDMATKMLDFDKPISEQSPEIQALAKKYKLSGEDLGGDLLAAARGKTPKGAQIMRDAGIPGVRYFDQDSRGAGAGTKNIVVFPGGEDQIKILKQEGSK